MKVTIQYSVDLEEVPNKVRDFLMKAAQQSQTIEDLKQQIRTGEMQQIYARFFEAEE